jgi:hypothetical protein
MDDESELPMGPRNDPSAGSPENTEDRRGSRRRRISYVKSAVLEVGQRRHIVALADLAPQGAFLRGAIEIDDDQELMLRLVLPRHSREVSIPCRLLRRDDHFDPSTGRPAGVAVRFEGVKPSLARLLDEFAGSGPAPSATSSSTERCEYRLLEVARLDEGDLNRLGLDGWRLTTVLPQEKGYRLILTRTL